MHNFLLANRDDLIARCKAKVELRPKRAATEDQLSHGVPIFLNQLIRTLVAEDDDNAKLSATISGKTGSGFSMMSEIGVDATCHGRELLRLGYTVEQVVHDYGDLCQAITDLAFERNAPFAISEFRTLNRCLDNAIAKAVTAFTLHHDAQLANEHRDGEMARLGILTSELRNAIGTAIVAVQALDAGNIPLSGATGAILRRSLATLSALVNRSVDELSIHAMESRQVFAVASFIADAGLAARIDASLVKCELEVRAVDANIKINVNRNQLHTALTSLLQNAINSTQKNTVVTLSAHLHAGRVVIEVADYAGGLKPGGIEEMFISSKNVTDNGGFGSNLAVSRQCIEAQGGTLDVVNLAGKGRIFRISLPEAHTH